MSKSKNKKLTHRTSSNNCSNSHYGISKKRMILATVQKSEIELTPMEIAQKTMVNASTTRNYLRQLLKEGKVVPWNKGKKGLQVAWNRGLSKHTDERIRKYSETRKKLLTEGKIQPVGPRGSFRHQHLVNQIAEWLEDEKNKVEIEKPIRLGPCHWRIIDILVNDEVCFEIGDCRQTKTQELTQNGFTVVHLPYSVFEGFLNG